MKLFLAGVLCFLTLSTFVTMEVVKDPNFRFLFSNRPQLSQDEINEYRGIAEPGCPGKALPAPATGNAPGYPITYGWCSRRCNGNADCMAISSRWRCCPCSNKNPGVTENGGISLNCVAVQ